MILSRVVYEFFQWEAERTSEFDEIERQIRLEDADGVCHYVSWFRTATPERFCVVDRDTSYFAALPDVERDQSGAPLWKPLVGREIRLEYQDDDRWTLWIVAGDARVVCRTLGRDQLYVTWE